MVANDATDPEQTRSSGSFAVSFQEPGEWRVLIESEGQQIAHTVYISTRDGRSQTPNPLVVELLPARETVGAGETIPVVVKAPSSGQLVLTVESDKVDWSQSVAMAGTEPPLTSQCPSTPGQRPRVGRIDSTPRSKCGQLDTPKSQGSCSDSRSSQTTLGTSFHRA